MLQRNRTMLYIEEMSDVKNPPKIDTMQHFVIILDFLLVSYFDLK